MAYFVSSIFLIHCWSCQEWRSAPTTNNFFMKWYCKGALTHELIGCLWFCQAPVDGHIVSPHPHGDRAPSVFLLSTIEKLQRLVWVTFSIKTLMTNFNWTIPFSIGTPVLDRATTATHIHTYIKPTDSSRHVKTYLINTINFGRKLFVQLNDNGEE